MKKVLLLLSVAIALMSCNQKLVYEFPFQNPELPLEERVEDMLGRMTLQEKISQLNYESAEVENLGIPQYNWWNECLHGVARSGIATVYPQAIGLAASWDKDILHRVATAISDEGRAKYHDFISKDKRGIYQGITFWTPNINIFRDPRWGRGMETYGECPYLTGEMAVQFIEGIQGDNPDYYKAIATAKHFAVHNGPESSRHYFDARVTENDLRNTYLPAFEKAVKKASVASVMCAYNRFEGEPCCGSSLLLQNILRDEWGFKGYVVSDCWALVDFYEKGHHEVVETAAEAAALAFKRGTDVNCGSVSPSLVESVEQGLITEAELDVAVRRLLTARFKMGMFDPDEMVPYSKIPYSVVDSKENQALALEAARKSMVLLKNDQNILPLDKEIKKIAVIGPNSNDPEVMMANYNGIPSNPVSPLQGIINKLPNAEILYSLGCEHAENLPTFEVIPTSVLFTDESLKEHGLKGEYFDNSKFEGESLHSSVDSIVDFYWWDKAPYGDLDADNFSARWTGVLVPPVTGKYAIGGEGFYSFEVKLDGKTVGRNENIHHSLKSYEFVELKAGKSYKVEVDFYDIHGDANVSLLWSVPRKDYEAEAIAMAKEAEVVVMFMGLSPRLEGEEMKVRVPGFDGGDRVRIDLPDFQQDFIKKIYAIGKPTVLVMLNGSAVAINWENENLPAIVEAWYPGQAAGTAIADVLFGDYNPAGRLPLTFYKDVKDIPEFENYNMDGFTYRYFKGEPLYHFGYGLSYTSFDYTEMQLESSVLEEGGSVTVSVKVSNSGKLAGDEVVQMYIRDVDSKEPRPVKDLRGFDRFRLEPGESRVVSFEINEELLAYWNSESHSYKPTKGMYEIMIGSSSRDEDLTKVELMLR
ncbi:MAG: glycoside hydrolase family 3 C-terminal domain-containing protein [Bacteroidales bacterium]|nr:glycoside hydrolase family 3 C-terminal domain-containing protein [Bacteroidales bacterium]MCF8391060.1 glycoside hydrolase family 3 C-terminal domain-containing protein [Bacteroidales bacterium]